LLAFVALCAPAAWARPDEGEPGSVDATEIGGQRLAPYEARRLLAEPLANEPGARCALLQRQFRAAQSPDDRAGQIELARQLAAAGRGRTGDETWVRADLNAEFTWGSSGKALDACETFVTEPRLSLLTRAQAALRHTCFAAQGDDHALLGRRWCRAEGPAKQALTQGGVSWPICRPTG